jgi:hypothetical protein
LHQQKRKRPIKNHLSLYIATPIGGFAQRIKPKTPNKKDSLCVAKRLKICSLSKEKKMPNKKTAKTPLYTAAKHPKEKAKHPFCCAKSRRTQWKL